MRRDTTQTLAKNNVGGEEVSCERRARATARKQQSKPPTIDIGDVDVNRLLSPLLLSLSLVSVHFTAKSFLFFFYFRPLIAKLCLPQSGQADDHHRTCVCAGTVPSDLFELLLSP